VRKLTPLLLLAFSACNRSGYSTGEVVPAAIDWKAVEAAIGRPGVAQQSDVYRFNFPRTDLRVMVGDVQVRPALALGGWVAFKEASGGAIATGDLVLTEDEVNPVISALQAGGVEQSAIHHHVMGESPRVLYVHIHGHGDPIKIATAVRNAVAVTKIPAPATSGTPPAIDIDTAQVASILKATGRANGGVFQFSIAWRFPPAWAWAPQSISSPRATAGRRSPATSS
jgi:hypothetical protein